MTLETPLDRFKRATTNAVRALAERSDVLVGFSSDPPGVDGVRARVPVPAAQMTAAQLAVLRGSADAAGLWLRHHDEQVHARQALATEGRSAEAFDALERARVETLGSREMSGVAANLAAALEHRCQQLGLDRMTSRGEVPMGEALGLLLRESLIGQPVPASARKAVDLVRPKLEGKLKAHLPQLEQALRHQARFGRLVRDLLRDLRLDDEGEASDEQDDEQDDEQGEDEQSGAPSPEPPQGESDVSGDDEPEANAAQSSTADISETEMADGAEAQGEVLPGDEDDDEEPIPGAPPRPPAPPADLANLPGYHVFTRQYDEVIKADDLADADEMTRLREMLDRQLQPLQGTIARLANRLQRRLQARQQRNWQFDLEEGILDAARLARVVVNPTTSLSFKRELEADFRDTVVTLLIDNSGSMRGRPITIAALSADILARTLERCGVKVEILGFTTRAWKGGRAREVWMQAGKPINPGRLNDLRHIIYKAADSPWRRARRVLGAMLREGILKENIDGEALIWAHERLMARPEQRRILMVISDGAPVDDATLSSNSGLYLEHHLRQVIEWIETRSPVELIAIGIGHDVTRYYRRAVTLVDAEQLGGTMMEKLAELFDSAPVTRDRRGR